MTEIFRGILDILFDNSTRVITELKKHIRKGNPTPGEDTEVWSGTGCDGFWNLMLEIGYTYYSIILLFIGVTFTFGVTLISFPIRLFFGVFYRTFVSNIKYVYHTEVDTNGAVTKEYITTINEQKKGK